MSEGQLIARADGNSLARCPTAPRTSLLPASTSRSLSTHHAFDDNWHGDCKPRGTMPDETPNSSFPATRQDLSNLKQTAVDAARDLGSTASVHAAKAQGNLKELASHAREESGDHLDQVK